MNQRSIILIVTAVLAVLAFFIITNQSNKQRFNWYDDFKKNSKQPYGTVVLHNVLEKYYDEHQVIDITKRLADELPSETEEPANYFFIGKSQYLDTAGQERLLEFVQNGNRAFIFSQDVSSDLMIDHLYYECDYEFWHGYRIFSDSSITLNLEHPALASDTGFTYNYIYNHKTTHHDWKYFPSYYFCYDNPEFSDIGTINDTLVNFVKINYGDGAFYLHTTPLVFSNYHLLNDSSRTYVKSVLAHLAKGDIYWDEFSKVPAPLPNYDDYTGSQARLNDESPLQYILSQDSLRWGWYLLLGLTFLYLAFRGKRRQRVVPVKEENTNTSMEFVETIGRLYFLQNDHKKLAIQKMKLFLGFIRERYHISTTNQNDKFFEKLAAISEIPRENIDKLFNQYSTIENNDTIHENRLIEFHLAMDYFYKNCK